MFGQLSEQLKKTAKPVNSVIAANTKTLEALSGHQTALFTGLLSDSVNFVQALSTQPTVKGLIAAQSDYAEAMRDRFTSATKETYSTLSVLRDDMTLAMKNSLDESVEDTKEVVATPKPAPAPKAKTPVVKKTTAGKTRPKPESTAETAPEEKVEPVKATDNVSEEAPKEAAPAEKKPATRARRTTAPKKAATPKTSTTK